MSTRVGAVDGRPWARIETAVIQIAVLTLVVASGRGDSFFWMLALVHAMTVGIRGTSARYHLALFTALPVLVAVAFLAIHRDVGAAALSLAIGALGVYVYWLMLGVARKLAAADRERQQLAGELAEARVFEERRRIARDIHDGIGADLAALDWRLRGLREQLGAAALQAEVDEVATRLAAGADDLRAVVWALRTPERTWPEIVAYVRQRAAELCGDRAATAITDGGDGGVPARAGEQALDYLRGVLELVRNATRHAGATHVAIALRSSEHALAAEVSDDGCGLAPEAFARSEGGLANLRHRAERAGGTLEHHAGAPAGTRFVFVLPQQSIAVPPSAAP